MLGRRSNGWADIAAVAERAQLRLPSLPLRLAWVQAAVDVLATFLVVKLVFYLVALFGFWMVPGPEWTGSVWAQFRTSELVNVAWHWDGEWYMTIIEDGYQYSTREDGYTNLAFFPLFPLATKLVGSLLPAGYMPLAGLLVNSLAFLGALGYLYGLAVMDAGKQFARRAVWFVAIVPSAFFFHVAYSESLFLLAASGTIYHVRRGQWWAAGMWAMLGSLTRVQGALLTLPLAWGIATIWWRERRLPWREAPPLLLPVLGLSLFMAYMYWKLGDPIAFVHAQEAWERSFTMPHETLRMALEKVAGGYKGHEYPLETLNIVMVFIYLGVALVSLRRWPAAYTLYVLASIAIAIVSPSEQRPIQSGARFMAVLFPVAFTVAAWSERWPWLGRLVVAVCLSMFGLLTALFVNWYDVF